MKSLKQKHTELCEIIGEDNVKALLHKWYNRVIIRERKRKGIPTPDKADFMTNVVVILADLNTRTGFTPGWKPTDDVKAMIQARFNDGYTVEDFKKVHEIKCRTWLDNDSRIYLRPSTLYRPSKFGGYLQEWSFNKNDEENKTFKKKIRKIENEQIDNPEDEYDPAEGKKIVDGLLKKLADKKKIPGGKQ